MKNTTKINNNQSLDIMQLINHLQSGIVVHGPDTGILLANQEASKLLGLSPEQLEGKVAIDPNWSFLRENGTKLPHEEYPVMRVIATGQPLKNHILGINRPDKGDMVWVQVNAFPELDDLGQISQIVVTFTDITEHKKAEETLRKNAARHSTILETAMDGIWLADLEGRLLEVNDAYCRMSGYSKEELLTMNIRDLKTLETVADTSVFIDRIVTQGEARFETVHRRKDGTSFTVEVSAQHKSSEKDYLVAFIRDITERKKAEEALRESEARYRTILETAIDGFWRIDLEGRILEVNQAYCHMSGYSKEELLGMNVADIECGETADYIAARRQRILKCGEARFETIHRRKDGTTFVIGATAQYKSPAKDYVAFIRDITEHKKAEEALRESEARYRTILQTGIDGFWRINLHGRILEVNEAYCRMSGYSEEELLGMSIHDIESQEIVDYIYENIEKTSEYGEGRFETIHQRKDGSTFTVETSFQYKTSERDYVAFIRDITERKQAEEALRESEERHRNIIQTAMDGFWLVNLEGLLLEVNEAYCKMSGYSKEELLNMAIPDLEVIENPDDTATRIKHIFKYGYDRFETKHRRKDGSIFTIEISAQYKSSENYMVVFLRDITERKEIEKALMESALRHRTILQTALDGFIRLDLESRVLEVNQAYCRMSGYSEEELLGMYISDLEVTMDKSDIAAQTQKIIEHGGVCFETMHRRKDGSIFPLEVSVQYNPSEGYIVSFLRDITERKTAEEALKKSEADHRTIIETALDGFWRVDLDGNIFETNESYCQMSGYSKEEVINKHVSDVDIMLTRDEVSANIQRLKKYGSACFETKQSRKDGSVFPAEVTIKYNPIGNYTFSFIRDITERKKAEEALRESEAQQRSILKTALNGFWRVDIQGRILEVNEAYCQMSRYSEEELLKMNVADIETAMTADEIMVNIQKILQHGSARFETKHRRKDGTIFPLEVSVQYNSSGNYMFSFLRDITERKKAEEALRASELRYRKILQTAMDGFMRVGLQGQLLQVNETYCRMSGYSEEELLKMTISDLETIENLEETAKHIRKILEYGEDRFESVHRRKDGTTFILEASAQYYPEEYYIVVFLRDITENKIAEKALRESEMRHRTILQTAQDGFVRVDPASRILEVNEAYCHMTGYSEEELLGMTISDLEQEGYTEENARRIIEYGSQKFEARQRRKDGSIFIIEASVQYNPVENYIVGFLRDITDRKQSEEELNKHRHHLEELIIERTAELEKAKKAAEAANESKSIFLANMSHELRTPMNAIIGFAELLERLTTDPKQKKYLTRIQSSGNTLLSLINDILDLSKIEAGKMTLKYSPVSIKKLFKDTLLMFSHRLAEKSLDYTIDMGDNVPESVLLDETRLRQVILNLVGNAIKFTHEGGIAVMLMAEYPEGNNGSSLDIIFSVKDTGIGIPKDQLESIFKPFEQEKGRISGEYGGTGLGLAISKNLISAMNGTISLESEIGKGSTFTVTLKSVEICAIYVKSEEKTFNHEGVSFKKGKILIVDDIDYNRDLIRGYISDYNFDIIEAENGKEAIEKIHEYMPDLILLDMKMPVMDGYTTAPIIKNDELTKHIPVIAVTASVLTEDEKKVRKICNGYIRKPLHRSELIEEMMKFLPYSVEDLKKESAPKAGQNELKEKIDALSRELIEEMCNAADRADIITLQKLIESLGKEQHFTDILINYIENYDYDGLKKFLKNEE